MGFSARNIETKLIVSARNEDVVLSKILEIANVAEIEQLTDFAERRDTGMAGMQRIRRSMAERRLRLGHG